MIPPTTTGISSPPAARSASTTWGISGNAKMKLVSVLDANATLGVGPFGFFSHPELTAEGGGAAGNQALGDAIAVFKWLKANVEAFGGDPNNITLFGESAGAAMNGGLVGAAGAKGTFERAIAQSGAWMGLGIGTMTPNHVEGATLPPPPPAGTSAPPPGPGQVPIMRCTWLNDIVLCCISNQM